MTTVGKDMPLSVVVMAVGEKDVGEAVLSTTVAGLMLTPLPTTVVAAADVTAVVAAGAAAARAVEEVVMATAAPPFAHAPWTVASRVAPSALFAAVKQLRQFVVSVSMAVVQAHAVIAAAVAGQACRSVKNGLHVATHSFGMLTLTSFKAVNKSFAVCLFSNTRAVHRRACGQCQSVREKKSNTNRRSANSSSWTIALGYSPDTAPTSTPSAIDSFIATSIPSRFALALSLDTPKKKDPLGRTVLRSKHATAYKYFLLRHDNSAPFTQMSRERAALLAELRAARQRVTDLEGELARQDAVAEDDGLTKEEYLRYGRQMILPAIGLPGLPSDPCHGTVSHDTQARQD